MYYYSWLSFLYDIPDEVFIIASIIPAVIPVVFADNSLVFGVLVIVGILASLAVFWLIIVRTGRLLTAGRISVNDGEVVRKQLSRSDFYRKSLLDYGFTGKSLLFLMREKKTVLSILIISLIVIGGNGLVWVNLVDFSQMSFLSLAALVYGIIMYSYAIGNSPLLLQDGEGVWMTFCSPYPMRRAYFQSVFPLMATICILGFSAILILGLVIQPTWGEFLLGVVLAAIGLPSGCLIGSGIMLHSMNLQVSDPKKRMSSLQSLLSVVLPMLYAGAFSATALNLKIMFVTVFIVMAWSIWMDLERDLRYGFDVESAPQARFGLFQVFCLHCLVCSSTRL